MDNQNDGIDKERSVILISSMYNQIMKSKPNINAVFPAIAILLASAFLFAAAFSITFGMQTDEHGNMSECPFMSAEAAICPMGVAEHIAKWQQFFIAIFSKSGGFASLAPPLLTLVLLLLTFLFLGVFVRAPDMFFPEIKLYSQVSNE